MQHCAHAAVSLADVTGSDNPAEELGLLNFPDCTKKITQAVITLYIELVSLKDVLPKRFRCSPTTWLHHQHDPEVTMMLSSSMEAPLAPANSDATYIEKVLLEQNCNGVRTLRQRRAYGGLMHQYALTLAQACWSLNHSKRDMTKVTDYYNLRTFIESGKFSLYI